MPNPPYSPSTLVHACVTVNRNCSSLWFSLLGFYKYDQYKFICRAILPSFKRYQEVSFFLCKIWYLLVS
uniref:Uncharacterized protein n=1 Tax=Oryza brachyantha TaxID=4533 RepID=J3LCB5_ORYBR